MRVISKRLFIGVDIENTEILETLVNVREELASYGVQKPVSGKNMHINLKFLGNVSVRETEKIKRRLEKVKHPGFTTQIRGISWFPEGEYIRVVYAGVEKEKLRSLREQIHTSLPGEHRNKGKKEYTPHITLSRVKNISGEEKKELKENIEKMKNIKIGNFLIDNFQLKESTLKKKGPVYNSIRSYELNDTL